MVTTEGVTTPENAGDGSDCDGEVPVTWYGNDKLKMKWESYSKVLMQMNLNLKQSDEFDDADTEYTGFAIWGRKKCGQDFLDKLNSREVDFDLFDTAAEYVPQFDYMRSDGSTSSITIQWHRDALTGSMGNAKKDQMYLMLSGLDKVDFGNKDMTECLLGAQIGAGASSLATDDQTYCVGWQKTIRN